MNTFNSIIDQILLCFRWKTFLTTFLAVFVMVALQYLGFKLPAIQTWFKNASQTKVVSPLPAENNFLQLVVPKLQNKINDFKLKKQSGIIETTHASDAFDSASAYATVDFETGEVVVDKNLTKKISIASTTKIMTAVVALDLANPEQLFPVSKKASRIIPTKIGVVTGEKMSTGELLNALLLTSANDAAGVLQEGIDNEYGEGTFVKAMNKKAEIIGLKNTHYTNPQGFDNPEHYSSAEDLVVLAYYAMKNYPLIEEIVKKDYAFLPADNHHKQFDLYNWNGLIGTYPGSNGVKIGNTEDAGYTTVVTAQRSGKKVITVLLGAPGVLERDLWAAQLLDLGFKKIANLDPVNLTEAQLKAKYATWKYWN